VYTLSGPRRDRYRAALRDKATLTGLDDAVEALLEAGAELSDPTRARPPKGFDPAGPAARYAVRERLHLTRRLPVPAAVTTADLVRWCAERLQPFASIHTWLSGHTS
jgi:hypothetical protein